MEKLTLESPGGNNGFAALPGDPRGAPPRESRSFRRVRHGFGQRLHDVMFILGVDADTAFVPDRLQQAHSYTFTRIFLFGGQVGSMPQGSVFRLRMVRPLNRYGLIGMGARIQGKLRASPSRNPNDEPGTEPSEASQPISATSIPRSPRTRCGKWGRVT